MAPTVSFLRPSPYLIHIGRLAIRDAPTPDDSTTAPGDTQEYNPVPPAYPEYNYPKWGIAVGTLCVALCCVGFSFLCAFLNRRNNKQAAFLAEFPCLDSKTHLATGLATSSFVIPTTLALSKYADAFGPATLAAEKTGAIGTRSPFGFTDKIHMPKKVTRVFRGVGRGRRRQEASVEGVPVGVDVVELKPVGLTSTALDPKVEGSTPFIDGETLDYNRPEAKKEDGTVGVRAPGIVPSSADVDAIAFVTEERFENVDLGH